MAELIRRHRLDAWAVFWSGPLAWFLQQLVLYQLTLPSCHGRPWLAPLVGAAFLLLPGAGATATTTRTAAPERRS
jgi:hypothetical protein